MKIVKRYIDFKKKIFHVKMVLDENSDDCWNFFNMLSVGDLIYGTCRRKIKKENLTGLTQNEMKVFNALIRVHVSKFLDTLLELLFHFPCWLNFIWKIEIQLRRWCRYHQNFWDQRRRKQVDRHGSPLIPWDQRRCKTYHDY